MKFTKEEISLCKQMAERSRKDIERGDWYVHAGDKKNMAILHLDHKLLSFKNLIPLWTISDCLEFLREEGFRFILHHYDVKEYHLGYGRDDTGQWSDIVPCKTPLEACLKAVLAVLEESK